MTSLSTWAMDFDWKGVLRPGMNADLTVFDPVAVESRAIFENPRRRPTDIFVVRDGEMTKSRPDSAVRKWAVRSRRRHLTGFYSATMLESDVESDSSSSGAF